MTERGALPAGSAPLVAGAYGHAATYPPATFPRAGGVLSAAPPLAACYFYAPAMSPPPPPPAAATPPAAAPKVLTPLAPGSPPPPSFKPPPAAPPPLAAAPRPPPAVRPPPPPPPAPPPESGPGAVERLEREILALCDDAAHGTLSSLELARLYEKRFLRPLDFARATVGAMPRLCFVGHQPDGGYAISRRRPGDAPVLSAAPVLAPQLAARPPILGRPTVLLRPLPPGSPPPPSMRTRLTQTLHNHPAPRPAPRPAKPPREDDAAAAAAAAAAPRPPSPRAPSSAASSSVASSANSSLNIDDFAAAREDARAAAAAPPPDRLDEEPASYEDIFAAQCGLDPSAVPFSCPVWAAAASKKRPWGAGAAHAATVTPEHRAVDDDGDAGDELLASTIILDQLADVLPPPA